jgi:SP family sugar:H+ symporter-like MFS transporter
MNERSFAYLCSSPKWIRGAVVGAYQWAITIGLLIAAVVNNATQTRDNASAYRIPISIQFVWAAILSFGMLWLPEVRSFFQISLSHVTLT